MGVVVEITGIAAGGAGVGRLPDGRVTFVQRTAVGDRAEVRVVEEKARWTRAELLGVVTPSADRRAPPCPHYVAGCGSCTLEHVRYDAQLRAKSRMVGDALRRIGKLDAADPPVVASPREFRYRNRVTFTLRRGRDGVVAGFREVEQPDRLVDVTEACLLPEDALAEVWGALRRNWGASASRLPSGDELRLTLRATESGEVSLAVDGGHAPGRPAELMAAAPRLRAVWHRPPGKRHFRLLAGAETLIDHWADEEVELSGDVFTQVNRSAAVLLEDHVMERIRAGSPTHVLDAYCGIGLYARRLVREGFEVTGIELHPDAVAEARRAAPEARVLEGRVEVRLLEALPADGAILNPPRAGLDGAVPPALGRTGPRRVVYVSCDPATLARDLGRLQESYRVVDVTCFDLFPQTSHVETVAELERS
jgi:23S rRNA (uracil1939-C5)-methyltransferase